MKIRLLASSQTLDGIKEHVTKYFADNAAYHDSVTELKPLNNNLCRIKSETGYLDAFYVEFKYKQRGPRYFFKMIY